MVRPGPSPVAPDSVADPARALIERQLVMLTRLAEIGMGIAEDAGRRSTALAEGPEAGATASDPALAYARAARAVRLTIALQSRLMNDLAALDRTDSLAEAARANARRTRIHHMVEQAVEAERDDDDEIERLSRDAWERLIDEDDADLMGRPLAQVVALICKDLGLSPAQGAWALEISKEASGGAADVSLPVMVRVAAQPPGGPRLWKDDLDPIPPPVPLRGGASP